MSNNIRYGFPKLRVNGDNVGFKTYTTCVYDMNGNTIEDRLNALPESEQNITAIKSHTTTIVNAVEANSSIKNDNSADVTSALNNLLSNYSHVYLPAGSYKVTGKLTIPAGKTLEGESPYNTFINVVGGSSTNNTGINMTGVSNSMICNLSIVGDNTAARTSAININGSFNSITLSNLIISNFNSTFINIKSTSESQASASGSNCRMDSITIKQNLTNKISTSTVQTGTCVKITLNNKKDTININSLICTSEEYVAGQFTSTYFNNFYNTTNNTFTTNKVPIVKGVDIIGPSSVNKDKSPAVHISNSIFEGMTEAVHCKQVSVAIVNCAFNLTIVGSLLADLYSNCQIIGCTFLTLYDYNSRFGYDVKRSILGNSDTYNLTVYDSSGNAIDASYADPQPLARLEIYDVCSQTNISKHPYILMLLSIIDVRVFTTEKYTSGTSHFSTRKLSVFGCSTELVHGSLENVTDG